MLQNEYLVAKIGVDTAENEPSKVWPACIDHNVQAGRAAKRPSPMTSLWIACAAGPGVRRSSAPSAAGSAPGSARPRP